HVDRGIEVGLDGAACGAVRAGTSGCAKVTLVLDVAASLHGDTAGGSGEAQLAAGLDGDAGVDVHRRDTAVARHRREGVIAAAEDADAVLGRDIEVTARLQAHRRIGGVDGRAAEHAADHRTAGARMADTAAALEADAAGGRGDIHAAAGREGHVGIEGLLRGAAIALAVYANQFRVGPETRTAPDRDAGLAGQGHGAARLDVDIGRHRLGCGAALAGPDLGEARAVAGGDIQVAHGRLGHEGASRIDGDAIRDADGGLGEDAVAGDLLFDARSVTAVDFHAVVAGTMAGAALADDADVAGGVEVDAAGEVGDDIGDVGRVAGLTRRDGHADAGDEAAAHGHAVAGQRDVAAGEVHRLGAVEGGIGVVTRSVHIGPSRQELAAAADEDAFGCRGSDRPLGGGDVDG